MSAGKSQAFTATPGEGRRRCGSDKGAGGRGLGGMLQTACARSDAEDPVIKPPAPGFRVEGLSAPGENGDQGKYLSSPWVQGVTRGGRMSLLCVSVAPIL